MIFGSADKLPHDALKEVSNFIFEEMWGLLLARFSINNLLANKENRTTQES